MASCDYKLCDICSKKHFYDSDIYYPDSEYAKALENKTVKSICDTCAKTHEIVIKQKDNNNGNR